MERLQNGTGLTTEPTRDRDDNITVTKNKMTMDSNMINLDDIYQIVFASNSKRREELLEFISDLIDIESDVMYEG